MGRKQVKLGTMGDRAFLVKRSGGKAMVVPLRRVSADPKDGEFTFSEGRFRFSKRDFLRPRLHPKYLSTRS